MEWLKRKRRKLGEAGQATFEFALVLLMLMAFVFFYIQLSLVFAWGNYVHYATFMSARAYLSAGPNREDQVERAKNVMAKMVKRGIGQEGFDRFPMVAKGQGGGDMPGFEVEPPKNYSRTNRTLSWLQGVRYTFRSKLFMIPLAAAFTKDANVNSVTLTSESWLGRESAFDECRSDLDKKEGIIDNGC